MAQMQFSEQTGALAQLRTVFSKKLLPPSDDMDQLELFNILCQSSFLRLVQRLPVCIMSVLLEVDTHRTDMMSQSGHMTSVFITVSV